MEDGLYKYRKPIIVVVAILLLAVLGFSIYRMIMNSIYSAKVDILVAPYIAKVKVGDDVFGVSGEHAIKPGEYNVEISADGFEPISLTISAEKGETAMIREYLLPLEENKNWYEENDGDAMVAGEIEYIKTEERNRELIKANPIMNDLPVTVEYYTNNYAKYVKYTIRYEVNDKSEITIIIDDYTGGNKSLAMEKLNSFEKKLDGYKIKYNDKSIELTYE